VAKSVEFQQPVKAELNDNGKVHQKPAMQYFINSAANAYKHQAGSRYKKFGCDKYFPLTN